MKCAQCRSELVAGSKFCSECGNRQRLACPGCDSTVTAGARFCHECGHPLATALAAEMQAAPRESELFGERRHMSVMFCDLVGSVEIARQLDPEDLRDLVRGYRQACTEVVRHHGGTMAQFHGDGIVVYFGYPVAQEDDARRAVQAGLDIVQAVLQLAPDAASRWGIELAVRVAVNTGVTVVGDIDASAGIGRLALGDTPNIAARLQQIAQPNSVVVSLVTQRLVAGFFLMTSLGAQHFKGVGEPIEAFSVQAASGARHRLEAAPKARLAPYVGRVSAVAALAQRWLAAKESPGHAVLLTGDPGIGKSRMLSEFRESIAPGECDIVECYCSPYYSHTALYPLVAPLRERLGIVDAPSAGSALQGLRDELLRRGCEIDTALPLLAKLLGIAPEAGYETLALHPLTQKQKTLLALVQILTSATVTQPMLMVVEDLHWVDGSTLELLGGLLRELPASRVLLLMTSRPGFAPPWADSENLTRIPINMLSAAETETLIQQVVGGKRLPPKLLTLLVDKTDGNPLYVEEMTQMLLTSGALRETSAGYELDGPLPDSMVPASLQDLLMARQDRMPPEAKKVLQLGACIGREWTFDLLLAVLPEDDKALSLGVEQLIGEGIVYATGRGFSFKHALIQDASYESLLKRTRQTYHERIALALQRGVGGASFPERIAQHFTKAGQPVRALPYWLEAGQQAVTGSAMAEAESHLRNGLEAATAMPPGPERDRQELALLSTLGVALTIQHGWAAPQVADAYQRAQTLSERLGPTPQLFWVLWGLWAFYLVKGEQFQAVEFAQRMASVADSERSPSLRMEANFALGLSHYYMGRLVLAQQALEAALSSYGADQHRGQAHFTGQDVGVTARAVAAMVQYLRGQTQLGLTRSRQSIALATELRHPFSHAYALGCAAWLDAYHQAPDAMAVHAASTVELATGQSLGFWAVWGTVFVGRALADQGHAAQGARHMQAALATYRSMGSGMVVPFFLVLLAEVEAASGDSTQALAHLAEARQVIAWGGESMMAAEVERLEARIRGALAAPDDATEAAALEQLCAQALAIAQEQGNLLFALRAATDLAGLHAARGDRAGARALLTGAIAAIPDTSTAPDLERARGVLRSLTATEDIPN